jgi:hypothetical protein
LIDPSQFLEHEIGVDPEQDFAHPEFEYTKPLDMPTEYRELDFDEDFDFRSDDSSAEHKENYMRLMMRNRIDMARMYIGKEGGYTLRTFKKMVKRAKQDDPDSFRLLMGGQEQQAV